jgi:hypothetical protein
LFGFQPLFESRQFVQGFVLTKFQVYGIGGHALELACGDEFARLRLDGIQATDVSHRHVRAGRVVVFRFMKLAACVCPATDFEDEAVFEKMIVDVESVGT